MAKIASFFDYEIEEQPEFLERRKLAKQLCWHWLQLELNCTYRASTLQELTHIPEDAQVLWLNDQLVDDERITYYLGKDKFDPQCVEEIFLKDLRHHCIAFVNKSGFCYLLGFKYLKITDTWYSLTCLILLKR